MAKRSVSSVLFPAVLGGLLVIGVLRPVVLRAQWTWHLAVGAESGDKGRQALAFLPNEIWIHEGDRIAFQFKTDEIHTVSFLKSGQVRPPFPVGCPGFSGPVAAFDDTTCVTTPPMVTGATFTVTFPKKGNYKVVCLVHDHMTGVVHVLDPLAHLPHDQDYYDDQGADQRHDLLSDRDENGDHDRDHDRHGRREEPGSRHHVVAGTGEITATPGGNQTLSIVRFLKPVMTIRAGQTVEWTNEDPITPHTVTFGTEPANPIPPSGVVTDPDGALRAIISTPSTSAHSGFLLVAPQDRIGIPQSPIGVVRFRATFPNPGVYPYICALHDDLGMKGKIIVVP